MAFKINTQAQPIPAVKPQQPTPQKTLPKPNNQNSFLNLANGQSKPQKVFPTQNLLNKYKTPSIFLNTQNALGEKLGIPNISTTPTNQDNGKNLLVEFLQEQNAEMLEKLEVQVQYPNKLESRQKGINQDCEKDFLKEILRKFQSDFL